MITCRYLLLTLLVSFISQSLCGAQTKPEDAIIGKWENVEHTLQIEVYKMGIDFKAKIIWFRDHDHPDAPMDKRLDTHNPDKLLKNRKVIGMDVLQNLVYNKKAQRWEHGIIYDATSGRKWNSSAWITKQGLLKVRGFWEFEFMGKTLTFKKI